jgi:hypothetical protein
MKNFNDQLNMGFKKYILFPVSTSLGALISALVILGSATAAIILLSSGFLFNVLSGNGRRNLA